MYNLIVTIILVLILLSILTGEIYVGYRLGILWKNFTNGLKNSLTNKLACNPDLRCKNNVDGMFKNPPDVIKTPFSLINNINKNNINIYLYCAYLIISIERDNQNFNPRGQQLLQLLKTNEKGKDIPIFGMMSKNKDDNNSIFISFRGTQTKSEWMSDFNMKQQIFKNISNINTNNQIPIILLGKDSKNEDPKVHSGFLKLYLKFRKNILSTLDKYKNINNLYITGHSLGAAIAVIAALDINNHYKGNYNINVITFAGPRIGNITFANIINDSKKISLQRIVNNCDIIPQTPLSVTGKFADDNIPYIYQHGGNQNTFYINKKSILNNHIMDTYIEYLKNF